MGNCQTLLRVQTSANTGKLAESIKTGDSTPINQYTKGHIQAYHTVAILLQTRTIEQSKYLSAIERINNF